MNEAFRYSLIFVLSESPKDVASIYVDNSNLINSILSGMFSIIAVLPAAYALIINNINTRFCGMPLVKICRFNYIWFGIPILSLLLTFIIIIYTNYNLFIFSIIFICFTIYLVIYLYLLLLPLFQKDQFFKIAVKSLTHEVNSKRNNEEKFIFYIDETIKSYYKNEGLSRGTFIDIYNVFKNNEKRNASEQSSERLMDLVKLLFLDNSISDGFSEYFVEMGNIDILLKIKYNYLIKVFDLVELVKMDEFCKEAMKFMTITLKEKLKPRNPNFDMQSTIRLIIKIIFHNGLTFIISDLVSADKYDFEYIEVILDVLKRLNQIGVDFEKSISEIRDKIFVEELFKILDGELSEFHEAKKYFDSLETLELVLKIHTEKTK